jgi:anti-sigma factor RsiW
MKCPNYGNISAYLDGELEEKKRVSLEAHLQGCAHCAGSLEEMRALRTRFRSTERYQAPYGFSTRVMARTADLDRKRTFTFVPALVKFAEAVALLLVIVVGIFTGKIVTNGSSTQKTGNITASLSLDVFEATPPGSLGDAYLSVTEARDEK